MANISDNYDTISTDAVSGRPGGLFSWLWAAQSISLLGSQVSFLAVPLIAVQVLDASPGEVGLLRAIELSPFLFLGLLVGAWVDRLRRRPVLISADLGRVVLLSSIPLAALFGVLRLELLYVVALLAGTLSVFSDLAGQAYLPTLVGRSRLQSANGRLELSRAGAAVLGPGLAGSLVALVGAPFAVAANAASFLASAALVSRIRHPESRLRPQDGRESIWWDIIEGLALYMRSPILRALGVTAGLTNLFLNAVLAVLVLFLARDLALPPMMIGSVFLAAGLGSVAGALTAPRISRRLGIGRAIVLGVALGAVGGLCLPLAGSLPGWEMPALLPGASVFGIGIGVWNVLAVTLRQAITPDHLQGRVTAPYRTINWGAMPIGALLGGLLAEALGVRATLVVGGLGLGLALLWVLATPLRRLTSVPEAVLLEARADPVARLAV